jgi:hypothetical protein
VSMLAVVIAASRGLGQAAAPLRVTGLGVILAFVAVQALSEPGANRLGGEGVVVALWTVLAMAAFACAVLARSALGGDRRAGSAVASPPRPRTPGSSS